MPSLASASPLSSADEAASFATSTLRLGEATDLAFAMLRCRRAHAPAAAALAQSATDWELPLSPNKVVASAHARALWLEPGAWLLSAEAAELGRALAVLRAEAVAAGMHLLATDVTSGRCALTLSGPDARALIASGCPIDLHPRAFRAGCCAASLFNETEVVIDQIDEAPTFRLICDRAGARALWDQLKDAAELLP